jgi:hypothetical protein
MNRRTSSAFCRKKRGGRDSANNAKNPELSKRAAEDLSSKLAKRGCLILVYSSSSDCVESQVVQGFLRAMVKRKPRSVEGRWQTLSPRVDPADASDSWYSDHDGLGGEARSPTSVSPRTMERTLGAIQNEYRERRTLQKPSNKGRVG